MIWLASRMPRPEWAPPPNFTMSVSWVMMRTFSIGTSYHSLTSWAKLVSWPWPCEVVPMTTSIQPSGCTVISVRSRATPVAVSR